MRNKLKREIYKKGFTVEEFAKAAGMSAAGLFQIFSGKYKTVKGYTIYNIAKAMDITYDEAEALINEE